MGWFMTSMASVEKNMGKLIRGYVLERKASQLVWNFEGAGKQWAGLPGKGVRIRKDGGLGFLFSFQDVKFLAIPLFL